MEFGEHKEQMKSKYVLLSQYVSSPPSTSVKHLHDKTEVGRRNPTERLALSHLKEEDEKIVVPRYYSVRRKKWVEAS